MTPAPESRGTVVFTGGTAWYLWNFRRNVIAALVERGWSTVAVAPEDESAARLDAMQGVQFVEWPVDLYGSNPIREGQSLLRLGGLLRRRKPSFVFNHGIKPNIYGGLACRGLGIPYANVVSGLGMVVGGKSVGARALGRLYGVACNGAETLFVQNFDDLARLREAGLSEDINVVRTMGSGVDLDHFAARPMPPASPRVFAFVGRLQRDKGIYEFVAAARRLRAEDPSTRFLVVGSRRHANWSAVSEDDLRGWAEEGVVELRGHCEDVRSHVAEAHAVVLPSHGGEGVPRVILEAAALGRPAVVSNVSGSRDAVVEEETGLICPPHDEVALLNAMRKIAFLPAARLDQMGRAAAELARASFSERSIIEGAARCVEDALRR